MKLLQLATMKCDYDVELSQYCYASRWRYGRDGCYKKMTAGLNIQSKKKIAPKILLLIFSRQKLPYYRYLGLSTIYHPSCQNNSTYSRIIWSLQWHNCGKLPNIILLFINSFYKCSQVCLLRWRTWKVKVILKYYYWNNLEIYIYTREEEKSYHNLWSTHSTHY